MSRHRTKLERIFEAQIQTLALVLRPGTVEQYRCTARRFLAHLRTAFPQVHQLSELHRDPHLLSWFRSLCEQQPPLSNPTRIHHLLLLRRLLDDLAAHGHSVLRTLSVAKISLRNLAICPGLFPSRTINSYSRNCAEPMIWLQMRFCSCAPPESASASAPIYLSIAFAKSDPINGPSRFPSASCTPSAWFPPILKSGGSWRGSLPSVLGPAPPDPLNLKACCYHVAVAIPPC